MTRPVVAGDGVAARGAGAEGVLAAGAAVVVVALAARLALVASTGSWCARVGKRSGCARLQGRRL